MAVPVGIPHKVQEFSPPEGSTRGAPPPAFTHYLVHPHGNHLPSTNQCGKFGSFISCGRETMARELTTAYVQENSCPDVGFKGIRERVKMPASRQMESSECRRGARSDDPRFLGVCETGATTRLAELMASRESILSRSSKAPEVPRPLAGCFSNWLLRLPRRRSSSPARRNATSSRHATNL